MTPTPVVVICGPTGAGKSRAAMALAALLPVEIINADSMQVYRGMDIGTAKPPPCDREAVLHHLLDIRDPDERFSAGEYATLFGEAVRRIFARGRLPVAVGGTGLYIRVALGGVFKGPSRDEALRSRLREEESGDPGALHRRLAHADPASAARILPGDVVRLVRALEVLELTGRPISELQGEHRFADRPFDARMFCLLPPRPALYGWIEDRVDRMMEQGLLEEVRGLRARGYGRGLTSMKGLGYRELSAHLDGEVGLQDAIALVKRNTRRYAKRQITWFRGEAGAEFVEVPDRESPERIARNLARDLKKDLPQS